jgi:hypothetical protein
VAEDEPLERWCPGEDLNPFHAVVDSSRALAAMSPKNTDLVYHLCTTANGHAQNLAKAGAPHAFAHGWLTMLGQERVGRGCLLGFLDVVVGCRSGVHERAS